MKEKRKYYKGEGPNGKCKGENFRKRLEVPTRVVLSFNLRGHWVMGKPTSPPYPLMTQPPPPPPHAPTILEVGGYRHLHTNPSMSFEKMFGRRWINSILKVVGNEN
jgi:hypothetical protein